MTQYKWELTFAFLPLRSCLVVRDQLLIFCPNNLQSELSLSQFRWNTNPRSKEKVILRVADRLSGMKNYL